jgi:hypothetical protein
MAKKYFLNFLALENKEYDKLILKNDLFHLN